MLKYEMLQMPVLWQFGLREGDVCREDSIHIVFG